MLEKNPLGIAAYLTKALDCQLTTHFFLLGGSLNDGFKGLRKRQLEINPLLERGLADCSRHAPQIKGILRENIQVTLFFNITKMTCIDLCPSLQFLLAQAP